MNLGTSADVERTKLETELQALMRDPKYWTSRRVQERAREACERLYGTPQPVAT